MGLNWQEPDVDNLFASSAEVKERVQHISYLLCGPSWPVGKGTLQNYAG